MQLSKYELTVLARLWHGESCNECDSPITCENCLLYTLKGEGIQVEIK